MEAFWRGFEEKIASQVSYKKHVIVFYWSSDNRDSKEVVDKARIRHPTVRLKTVKIQGGPLAVRSHKISALPTVILLRNGQEIDRLTGKLNSSILEQFFRKALT